MEWGGFPLLCDGDRWRIARCQGVGSASTPAEESGASYRIATVTLRTTASHAAVDAPGSVDGRRMKLPPAVRISMLADVNQHVRVKYSR